ncbi:MAG: tripartite tricarboxylate transporter TctB family protein [Deltaproteobacteria bacterium]|nr:tripartite tricarboxylate transporter TctB family protein [Deltaproteobacteria bacterium]
MDPMKSDRGSSLFWLLLSLTVMAGARRLGIGSLTEPGSGFVSFWAALLLAVLSSVLLLRSTLKRPPGAEEPLFRGKRWPRVVFVCAALFAYTRALEYGGYLLTTFLLMAFLFWLLERKKAWGALAYAAGTTVGTYLVFSKCLNCRFPSGLLGF